VPLRISDSVIWQEQGDGVSLYHLDHGFFLTLNESGARIWKLLGDGGDVDAIVARLALEFGGSSPAMTARIRGDVQRFITTMTVRELVTQVEPT
jgi:hypothetical protein